MEITSQAFPNGGIIPRRFTCDGDNLSPPFQWGGSPSGTKSFALIVDDPDAPSGTFVHWVLFDIPSAFSSLSEGVQRMGVMGSNSYRKLGYNGPCPPPGPAHRYFFKLYALDRILGLSPGSSKADVEKAIQGHILAQAEWVGRYSRP
jgi:hypothetical protein